MSRRVLVITALWPNLREPHEATFNLQQLKALRSDWDVHVMASLPWFPGSRFTGIPRRASLLAGMPMKQCWGDVPTSYFRYLHIPKVGVPMALPFYMASAMAMHSQVRRADVILGTWAYPDACAAVLLAKVAGKPCVVKVHGSDINVVTNLPGPRQWSKALLPHADGLVAVSSELRSKLVRLGAEADKIRVVPNGIDKNKFVPRCKTELRRDLGLSNDSKVVLFVGRLEAAKGVHELLEAWDGLHRDEPRAVLVMVGTGVDEQVVRSRALGLAPSIRLLGKQPHEVVARYMAASDLLTLPSWREGTPNVVLEASACGIPVVATAVGGIPEVVRDGISGVLVPPKAPRALEDALRLALARPWNTQEIIESGPVSWHDSARLLGNALESAILQRKSRLRGVP
jgi:glycosyltransferase involved in cell wall biosynthesis